MNKSFTILLFCVILTFASAFIPAAQNNILSQVNAPSVQARKNAMIMRERKCDLLGKRANRQARIVTFSHRRIKKVQEVNLHTKKMFWEEGKKFVRLRLSTKGLRTIKKYGLNAAAKKFEVDLHKFTA
jgi:large subunit ribosomal protein L28